MREAKERETNQYSLQAQLRACRNGDYGLLAEPKFVPDPLPPGGKMPGSSLPVESPIRLGPSRKGVPLRG